MFGRTSKSRFTCFRGDQLNLLCSSSKVYYAEFVELSLDLLIFTANKYSLWFNTLVTHDDSDTITYIYLPKF